MRTVVGRDWQARVAGKPDATGFAGAVGTGDFAPAAWLSLSPDATVLNVGQSALPGEISAGNLAPALATWAHTTGAQTYTLSRTFTADQDVTVQKYGVKTGAAGVLVYQNFLSDPAQLFSADQMQLTVSVDLG